MSEDRNKPEFNSIVAKFVEPPNPASKTFSIDAKKVSPPPPPQSTSEK